MTGGMRDSGPLGYLIIIIIVVVIGRFTRLILETIDAQNLRIVDH
jgi:hypothetical protein